MAGCDPRTYHNVNRRVFEGLSAKLSENGYAISGNSGRIKGPFGIVLDFQWDESNETLHLHVVDKNFLVPCSQIRSYMDGAIIGLGGK